jgi:uncharacterized membrane protein (UPF0127 family)
MTATTDRGRRRMGGIARCTLSVLMVTVALVASGCTSAEEASGLGGFATAEIVVGGRAMTVAVADTPEQRSQGLMGVTDLDGVDGMLFVFRTEVETEFWMKDTLVPLDIAFFGDGGGFVDLLTMQPCTADPCPTYGAAGPYRYALEAPAGDLSFVDGSSTLVFDG